MKPPEWLDWPPGEVFDRLYEVAPVSAIEAARANAQAIALDLAEVGITVDCLPLLDVRQPGAHDVIGDRALGAEPMRVAALGRAVLDGLARGGVVGTIKHMPGHGRATATATRNCRRSPRRAAELETTSRPFRALAAAPMAMTAHVRYTAWDAENPAHAVADRDRRHHPRADRLRRPAAVRRSRHGGAVGRGPRARGARDRGGLRHRAPLLGGHGRDGGMAEALPAIARRRRARLDRAMAAIGTRRGPTTSANCSPSAMRCWRWRTRRA